MALSEDQVRAIKSEFMGKYFFSGLYRHYMRGCGMSDLRTMLEKGHQMDVHNGATLDDLCFTVSLRQQPPVDISLPQEYQGVQIFYHLEEKKKPKTE